MLFYSQHPTLLYSCVTAEYQIQIVIMDFFYERDIMWLLISRKDYLFALRHYHYHLYCQIGRNYQKEFGARQTNPVFYSGDIVDFEKFKHNLEIAEERFEF